MGIELAVACVPCAQLNDLRVQALHDQIDRLTDEDLEFDNDTLDSEDHGRDALVRILHDQIDLLRSAEDTPHCITAACRCWKSSFRSSSCRRRTQSAHESSIIRGWLTLQQSQ